MTHVPMCKLCGEYEVATFQVHNDFCSDMCADKAYEYTLSYNPHEDYDMSYYDNEPDIYAGTYSEE